MAKKPNKPKRRLKNVTVCELSLVDRGAVPESDFVTLSKRIETEPEVSEENQESEIAQLAKAMDEEAAYEATTVLRLMADITSLATTMKKCLKRLPDDLQKAFGDLKSAMYDEKVEKVEEEEATEEEAPVEKNEPEEKPVKKTAAQEFEDAVSLIRQRKSEMESREDERVLKSALDSMQAIRKELVETQEQFATLKSELAHAKGTEQDDG